MSGDLTARWPEPPLDWRRRLRAYLGVAQVQLRTQLQYRSNFLIQVFGTLVQIYLLKIIWTAVFPASGSAATNHGQSISLHTQIAYATIATLQSWLLNPWNLSLIPGRVRSGHVAVDLARPVSFPVQMLWAQLGSIAAAAPFILVALPFGVLIGGADPPASTGALVAYLCSVVPGVLTAQLLGTVLGLVSFWTLEVDGIHVIYRMVNQFLAGALVPLWFMPDWLRTVASALPFHSSVYTPVAAYLGKLGDGGQVAAAIGLQWLWVLTLCLLLRLTWSRALHRVVVQGG